MKFQRTKYKILSAVVLVFFGFQFLNFTGFCYPELRYLSERELVDRHLFGIEASHLTEKQKAQKIMERGGTYPDCCTVNKEPWMLRPFDKFINKILGRYLYEIEIRFPQNISADKKYPYLREYFSSKACGGTDWLTADVETETEYSNGIKDNAKFWESK